MASTTTPATVQLEPEGLPALVERFRGAVVAVVGESYLDAWYAGNPRGLSRDGAVPVVQVQEESFSPGGAANTARALAALGAEVRFVSVVGDDSDGDQVRALLREAGVDDRHVVVAPGRRTVSKRRVVCRGQVVARFDAGDVEPVPGDVETDLLEAVDAALPGALAVVAADYGSGVHTPALAARVAAAARSAGARFVLDGHDLLAWAEHRPDVATPDAEEVEALLDRDSVTAFRRDRLHFVQTHGDRLRELTGATTLVVTLDEDGAVVLVPGAPPQHVTVPPVEGASGTGAGDTFVSAATLALTRGCDIVTATRIGCAAAGVVVRRTGTPVCSADDLRDTLLPPAGGLGSALVTSAASLAERVAQHRRQGRRIVFTNGCFDVLHRGHIAYLDAARRCGDVLVVGVNSDASVRRLKGPDRPVNPVEDRVAVLCGLAAVDHVVVFDGDTPADVLELVRPEVYVKGGDYSPEMLPEAPLVRALGGEVVIVDYVEDRSTTLLLDRVRGTTVDRPAGSGEGRP